MDDMAIVQEQAGKRGEMAIMGREGDTKIMWDKSKKTEVDIARATFEKFRKDGYLAFSVTGKDGAKGEQITAFSADEERIIFVPPMVGG